MDLPNSVTTIEEGAFYDCPNLADDDGFVTYRNIIFGYHGDESELIISNGVTRIDYKAFSFAYNLKKITFPETLKSVGSYAFQYCLGLTNIELPNRYNVERVFF
jgi:hypothetical protein